MTIDTFITLPSNPEIHFAVSNGVISRNFPDDPPDYPLFDSNFSTTTAEATALLAELQIFNLNDERPLWEILGLAIPADTVWKELRIGELKTLLDRSDRFFGLHTLGADMEGSAMHQTLLAAYDKLFAGAVA
ncbi:MAG: hypothetical protein ABI547_09760 [Betaproteobacteria bacterium]